MRACLATMIGVVATIALAVVFFDGPVSLRQIGGTLLVLLGLSFLSTARRLD